MSYRYLRTFDNLTNISKVVSQQQQQQQQHRQQLQLRSILRYTTTTSSSSSSSSSSLYSSLSSTIMRLLKPNSITNITIFFAASLVAAWSVPLLVDGTEFDYDSKSNSKPSSAAASESDSVIVESADSTTTTASASSSTGTTQEKSTRAKQKCPSYGCPLLPRDIYFDKEAQAALQAIRNLQQLQRNQHKEQQQQQQQQQQQKASAQNRFHSGNAVNQDSSLSLFYNEAFINTERSLDQATLTLIGYKGGELHEQINQDRAFVISPFYIFQHAAEQIQEQDQSQSVQVNDHENGNGDGNENNSESKSDDHDVNDNVVGGPLRLLGVFDGHAKLGERVSEYSVRQLPQLLSSKLESILSPSFEETKTTTTTTATKLSEQKQQIQNAIIETFIEIDKTAPAHESGGCTASIVLQIKNQIYVANAGDSRSFIATYNRTTKQTDIVYVTREDKPDIPEERSRVESAGGMVYIPPPDRVQLGASSRVVYVDKNTGSRNGLAMSRSIGDWAAGVVGVIPDPMVKVLDIEELVDNANSSSSGMECDANYDLLNGENIEDEKREEIDHQNCRNKDEGSDVEVFAVSATDGLLDFINVEEIAKTIAMSLYIDDAPHPLSACESLITTAASQWYRAKNGRYRDDIAIAVSKLSLS